MPLISVVIPAFNSQKTIARCIASIGAQTLKDFEIIVVNDGSTDATKRIVAAINTVTLINQTNLGAAAARNRGTKEARGNFIIFCDADIVAEPTLLQAMYNALQKTPTASYAYSSFKFGHKTFKLFEFDPARLKRMPYIHTTSLIRREHFPGFDERLKRFQDWDLWLTMFESGHTGIFVDEVLFQVTAGGTMSQWLPKIAYQLPFLPQVKAYHQAETIIKSKHRIT